MAYSAEVLRAFAADPTDPRHGTVNGYTNLQCRCTECTAANRLKNRDARREARESAAAEIRLVRDESWMLDAACRSGDADWFPEVGSKLTELRRVCAGCPVRTRCLAYALEWNERHGCWGGHSERQRRELKRTGTSAEVAMARFDRWAAEFFAARPVRGAADGHRPGFPVSYASYVRGCRCDGCRACRNDYEAAVRAGVKGRAS